MIDANGYNIPDYIVKIASKFADVFAFKAHCRALKKERYTLAEKIVIERILRAKGGASCS